MSCIYVQKLILEYVRKLHAVQLGGKKKKERKTALMEFFRLIEEWGNCLKIIFVRLWPLKAFNYGSSYVRSDFHNRRHRHGMFGFG